MLDDLKEDDGRRNNEGADKAIRLHNLGLSTNDIAEELGVHRQSLYDMLERRGIHREKEKSILDPTKRIKKFPVNHWAKVYDIPVNSCYMAFRRKEAENGTVRKQGCPNMMTRKEFLSLVIYTRRGQYIFTKLIMAEKLLTREDIKASIG